MHSRVNRILTLLSAGTDYGVLGMFSYKHFSILLISSTMFAASACAADIVSPPDQLAAVSEINGKLEFGGGFGGMTGFSNTNPVYGDGSITMPLGNAFGLQGDFAVDNQFGQTEIGGAGHLFTRDPNRYLLGAMGGYASFGQASGAWIGPEAELYADRISFEAIGGYIRVTPNGLNGYDKLYAVGNIGYYATNNLRFTIGAGTVADFKSAHLGAEYLLSDVGVPVSLKLDGRVGDNNFYSATAGLAIYFGGPSKDLIRRHREDDPPNGVQSLFSAGGVNLGVQPAPGVEPNCVYDPESHNATNEPCIGPENNS
jgi:hypothetical protein